MTVPFTHTDAPFWKARVFDGIDEMDVKQAATACGTVETAARGSKAGAPGPRPQFRATTAVPPPSAG
ncbi:hypothetical protein [Streptomyces sp. NBC_00986]|uniref:hypothetical protein n=1 Tax=Streptomyces sp. NBC_00986 TaxID=2903702 RepID=UPI003867B9D5|nr:hypothetical protein OG504_00655 [Streptomyces sp. NBC_00986]